MKAIMVVFFENVMNDTLVDIKHNFEEEEIQCLTTKK